MNIMKTHVPHNYAHIYRTNIVVEPIEKIIQFNTHYINAKLAFDARITYANVSDEGDKITNLLKRIPLSKIITETNNPNTLPLNWSQGLLSTSGNPWNNIEVCHPGMVKATVQMVSEIKEIPIEIVAQQTFKNVQFLYNL